MAYSDKRIPELDGLRGIAILMVMGIHYMNDNRHGEFGSFLYKFGCAFRLGWSGVDLFFVLSGFLIGGILLESRNSKSYFKTFYLRRFHRIVPIFYLLIICYALVVWFAAEDLAKLLPIASNFSKYLPVYFLFLQNFIVIMPARTLGWYWFIVTWSLAVEEQFYLVAPPLIRMLNRESLKRVLTLTIILAPFLRTSFLLFWPGGWAAIYNWMPCRADSLAIGILASLLWQAGRVQVWYASDPGLFRKTVLLLALPLLPCLKWIYSPFSPFMATVGYTWLGLLYGGVLLLSLCETNGTWSRFLRNRFLREMGKLSYCIYLVHYLFLALLHAAILHAAPRIDTLSGAGVTLLAFVATYTFAKLSWLGFEAPLIRHGRRFIYT